MSRARVKIPSGGGTPYALDVEDEGLNVVNNPTALNFTGSGVTVTENPTGVAEIDIPGNPITVSDEGTPVVVNPLFINFAGAGVAVTNNPIGTALVTIPDASVKFWTESESAATQQNTRWTPNNVAADVTAVIQPKGNGALTAQRPDGTTVGGNARGTNAIDLQMSRTNANQVASGIFSVISGGQNNRSSGEHSIIVGGQNCVSSSRRTIAGGENSTASNPTSTAFGRGCTASGERSLAIGNDGIASAWRSSTISGQATSEQSLAINDGITRISKQFAQGGQFGCQASDLVMFARTNPIVASGDAITLNLGNITFGSNLLIVPDNSAHNVNISWVALIRITSGSVIGVTAGDMISQTDLLAFKRIGGTSSIVGSVTTLATQNDLGMATASMAYTVGGSQELAITFTAPTFTGGGFLEMRITAKVQLSEAIYQ